MVQKILIPIDGSQTSGWVLLRARELMKRPDVFVKLVTVVETTAEHAHDLHYRADSRHQPVHAALWAICNELRRDLVNVEAEVLFGDPATGILREIAAGAHDLVVMATHARIGLDRLFFGSVALKVLQASPVPLMLLRPLLRADGSLSPASSRQPARFKRILIPLDGSEAAEEILPEAEALAGMFGSCLYLYSSATEGTAGTHVAAGYLTEKRCMVEQAGLEAQIRLRSGDPAQGAIEMIADGTVDAVAMTTHGRTGLARMLFGSVAETILTQVQVPMLVLRNSAVRAALPVPTPELQRVRAS